MSILVTYVLKWLRNGPYGLWEWIDVNWKHTINEKAVVRYTHTHTHNLHLGRKQFTKKELMNFVLFPSGKLLTDRQTDRWDSASNMPMYIQTSSIPFVDWVKMGGVGAGRGRGGKWINKLWGLAKSFPSCVSPLPTEESSSWWGMSILLFVMCKAPKQTAAITSSTTTEGLVG